MLRSALVFSVVALSSLFASASPADLVGAWATPCTPVNGEFGVGITELTADGQGIATNHYYDNAQCSGNAVRSEEAGTATYTATETSITFNINSNNAAVDMVADYVINGDILTVTPTSVKVNGEDQPLPPASTVKRVR